MSESDRPLYEDLLKQRNDLEKLCKMMIGDLENVAPAAARVYQRELDEIIIEERRQGGLT